jgi:ABC-type transport system involved in multi-copper enzyme maturation permease subunit
VTTAALIVDTFREAMARKIFWGLFALSGLMLLFFLFIMRIDVVEGAVATMTLFGQTTQGFRDAATLTRQVHSSIATFLYTFGMFLAVFASAGLIPSVLEPGRIELMLSKPVTRRHLLLGRYIGNILIIASIVTFLVTGIWMIFGWKTGVWNVGFLVTIPFTLVIFAVLLTVVVWAGVLWESTAVSTMIPVVLMIVSPILAQNKVAERLLSSQWSRDLWNALYYVLPKVFDTGRMTLNYVQGKPVDGWMPLWSSALFGIVVLGWSLWIFEKRDF